MKHKLKIGIVCYPTFGGSGVIATELGHHLGRRGHEVYFIAYNKPARLNLKLDGINFELVDVVSYPLFRFPPYTLALASKLYKVITEHDLDIIHCHYAVPHSTSACIARQMVGRDNIVIITTLHGTDVELIGIDDSYRDVVAHSLKHSNGITAVSEFLKKRAVEEFSCKNIEVIPNFIDTEVYNRRPCGALGEIHKPNNEKLLIHISNFREVKNTPDVVKIFQQIHAQHPSRLMFIGEGPYLSVVKELVDDYGLQEAVDFIDFTRNVVGYLSLADCFLLTSRTESFGLVLLEAMACKTPVVAYRVGGIPEVMRDGQDGFLVEYGHHQQAAQAILRIFQDGTLHERLSSNARQRAEVTFSTKDIIERYEEYYYRFV